MPTGDGGTFDTRLHVRRWVGQFDDVVTQFVDSPVQVVWPLVEDVTRMPAWSPECRQVEWVPPHRRVRVGAVFRGYNRRGWIQWSTICRIVEHHVDSVDHRYRLTFVAGHWSGAATEWTYIVAQEDSGTRLTIAFRSVGTSRTVLFLDRLVGRPRGLRADVALTLSRIAAAARTPLS
ncbi:SRPBCC family protein [Nocardia sp. NPDC052278]|uniref:SRPBCC family protein n=1 Tax=unclassified Nocardia TaxID=2637762 RepID=UPI00368A0B30